uniref:Uncharacterized protein n=1 Tax=Anguilla anguilla TaxID=7936 RepID=A0A0E9TKX1_ANGAN
MPRLSINIAESQQTLEMKSMLESSEASAFLGFSACALFFRTQLNESNIRVC